METKFLHVDDALIVAEKPAGLLSVPGRGEDKQDCLSRRAQARFPDARIVHRLDRDTSGLMLMGRGAAAQRSLSIAFAQRQVHKRYIAVVDGSPAAPAGEDGWGRIELAIHLDWPNRPRRVIDPALGKPSVTRWRVLERLHTPAAATRVELEPVTGRSHQLRVHLLAIGHPILGDSLYAPPAALARADRLLLHAHELAFVHPATGETLRFASPAPF